MRALVLALVVVAFGFGMDVKVVKRIMNQYGCIACHDLKVKKVGPPFEKVAQKYKGMRMAEKKIVRSILMGSRGKWGGVMPPQRISPKDAHAFARALLK